VKPLQEWEVLYVTEVACRDKAYGDQERPAIGGFGSAALLWIVPPATSFTRSGKRREQLHATAMVTIVPSRESDERNILIGKTGPRVGLAVVRRQAKMGDAKPRLQTLLAKNPSGLRRALLLGMRPDIQPRRHQRFVSREVDHRSDTKRRDQLPSTNWPVCRHGLTVEETAK